jgi:hypothetical protein
MGFVLSILYFLTYYLTAPVLFGKLAEARVELILAILLLFVSLPKLAGSMLLKTTQTAALVGLALAGSFSILFGQGWLMGALAALPAFAPFVYAYIMMCLHCNSLTKLKTVILILLFACLFVTARGFFDLHSGTLQSGPSDTDGAGMDYWNIEHPYLFAMKNDAGETFYRLRGVGYLSDPNDFGQMLVCVVPLSFIFWKPRKLFWNAICVMAPLTALLFGVYLTHSRGALLALMAMTVVAARRRIGTIPALLIAGVLFIAAMSLHFTGGREISADKGSDRTTLWSEGMQMLKTHPFFGVGLGSMTDYTESHLTAHNSVMVCAAELGMFGLFSWSLFLFPTARDALALASPSKVSEADIISDEKTHLSHVAQKPARYDKAKVNQLGRCLVLSITGFVVTGWFLSRAYVMTFFLLGGMVEVAYEMALQKGMVAPRLRLTQMLPRAGGLALSLVLLVYIMLRFSNLMH